VTADTTRTDLFAVDASVQDLLYREARTAKRFTDTPVDDDHVRALYELVRWAPTSMNAQPLRIIVARSDEARARVLAHVEESNLPKIGPAPILAILAADTDFHEYLPRVMPYKADEKEVLAADEDRRVEIAVSQAWLQAGYLFIGVRALGLDVLPIAGYDAAALDADLLVGTPLRSVCLMAVGYPAEDAYKPRHPRLDFDEAVSFI
jgi:3-hydroxypropanoate dehydrogenase